MNKFQYSPPKNIPVSSDDLIKDLRSVAEKLNTKKLTQSLYSKHGKYNPTTVSRRFGTWNHALLEAKINPSNTLNYSDEQLFENILNVWQKKGAQPAQRDMKTNISEISPSPYYRRFNTWTTTIKEFIKYANEKDIATTKKYGAETLRNRTSRDPSLRLRFKVLKRDNFSCAQCGASPAKNPIVILHVDHMKPWSKGGETEITNLQTLCQNCNIGKSDLE